MVIYARPHTSLPLPGHQIHPYLLQRLVVTGTRSGLVFGHHLCAYGHAASVFGGGDGLVETLGECVVHLEIGGGQRAFGHLASALIGLNFTQCLVVAVRGVAQNDSAQHRPTIFASGQFGVGVEIVRRISKVRFKVLDVPELVATHIDTQPNRCLNVASLPHPPRAVSNLFAPCQKQGKHGRQSNPNGRL